MPSPSLTLLRAQSDERLVDLARDGHERAFEAIVERYRRPLLRAARRVLPEGRAEDALQHALLAAWTALQRGDEVRELRPWLYRIVHNTSLNALRMSGYDYAELQEAARIADAADDELERRAVVRQTLASLAALPERQREALIRTAVSGDSQEAVARDLGLSDNALRQLVHRARVSMRAAATALTPLPLVTAAASGPPGGGPLVERISEIAAGGGASLSLAKAGAVVVLAGGAISGPAIVDNVTHRSGAAISPAVADAATRAPESRGPSTAAGPAEPLASAAPVRHVHVVALRPRGASTRSRGGGDDGADERSRDDSGSGRSGSDGSRSDRGGSGSSGPGGGDDPSGSSGSGHDGSGDGGSGSSGGTVSSGSGSSGSGSSDSGSSGSSGSGDSGSSGSGSSGSGSVYEESHDGSGERVEPTPTPTVPAATVTATPTPGDDF